MVEAEKEGTFKKYLKLLLIGSMLFSLASYIFTMALGAFLFVSPEGLTIAKNFVGEIFVYVLFTVPLVIPTPVNVGLIFFMLWGVYWLCLLLAWKGPIESISFVFKQRSSRPTRFMFRNFMFAFPIASAMLILATILIESLQEAQGIPTGNINIPNPYELFFTASYAAVSEEIGFRLVPIGFIAAIWVLWACWRTACKEPFRVRLKLALLTVVYPERGKKKAGLRRVEDSGLIKGISRPEWTIVILSAFVFGMAHILAGSGWGLGKFTTAFMAGVFFGVIYLNYGITASILMHWFFNYHLTVFSLSYQKFGVPLDLFINFTFFFILALGIAGWLGLAVNLLFKAKKRIKPLENHFINNISSETVRLLNEP